jgi:hypothetical protein
MNKLGLLSLGALIVLFIAAFSGPVTNSIQRVANNVGSTSSPVDVAVSPTALPTTVNPYDPNRAAYTYILTSATATSFACCTIGTQTGGAATVPVGTTTACTTGFYLALGTGQEIYLPRGLLSCITENGTVNFSFNNRD